MSVAIPVIDSYDGATRRIYLKQGVDAFHWIEDVYREYINERQVNEGYRKWFPMMKQAGNNPKGGGKYTPRYITLLDGCRVIPYDENILITVTGEAITDNADVDPDPFDTSSRTQPLKLYITPPAAEIVRDVEALAAIEAMSFDRCVTMDIHKGISGTAYPAGNTEYFSNNMADGLQIAVNRRLHKFCVQQDIELGAEAQVPSYKFEGLDALNTSVNVLDAADVAGCQFLKVTLSGILDGLALVENSRLLNVSSVNGIAYNCMIEPGALTLAAGVFHLLDCKSGLPGTDTPIIDFNAAGCALGGRGYAGGITFINKSGPEAVSFDLSSGQVKIDMDTVTNGTIVIRGDGKCVDLATGEHIWTGVYGDLIIVNETNSPDSMARGVWSTEIETGYIAAELIRVMSATLAGKMSVNEATGTIIFRDVNDLVDRLTVLRDALGNRTETILDVN